MTVAIQYPFVREKIRRLRLGQHVLLSGRVVTGRDRFHKYLAAGGRSPVPLKDGAIFHCGPAVMRVDGQWVTQAAGPTTSIREEPYTARVIEEYGVRVLIGKGGMGPATRKACAKFGCVYLQAVGGAAQILNATIKKVEDVHFLREFGATEALWVLSVQDLPAVVAIDSRGRSLHAKVRMRSARALRKLLRTAPPFVS